MAFWRRRKKATEPAPPDAGFESFTASRLPDRPSASPRVEARLFPPPDEPGRTPPDEPVDEPAEPTPEAHGAAPPAAAPEPPLGARRDPEELLPPPPPPVVEPEPTPPPPLEPVVESAPTPAPPPTRTPPAPEPVAHPAAPPRPRPEPAAPTPRPDLSEPEPATKDVPPVRADGLQVKVHDERLDSRSTPVDLTPSEALVLARDGRHALRRHVEDPPQR